MKLKEQETRTVAKVALVAGEDYMDSDLIQDPLDQSILRLPEEKIWRIIQTAGYTRLNMASRQVNGEIEAIVYTEQGSCPRTNADRIRAMTDDELAIFLSKTQASVARTTQTAVAYRAETVEMNLEWLREAAYGNL